jgi:hypothetical protein
VWGVVEGLDSRGQESGFRRQGDSDSAAGLASPES